MAYLDVNTDEMVRLTLGLEKIRKSAFPKAVRDTLNSVAFDVKKTTLPASTRRIFTQRRANFFKANSRVEMAKGNSVDGMRSMVGMVDKTGKNQAIDDLVQQERGGKIKGRSFIPLDSARVSSSYKKNVKSTNRLRNIDRLVSSRNTSGSNKAQRLIKSVKHAGQGGNVLDENGIVWKVEDVGGERGGGFKLKAIYSFKARRTVNVRATHFMAIAGEKSGKMLPDLYVKNAGKLYVKALGL